MYIYGGYQDMRGSLSELWQFSFGEYLSPKPSFPMCVPKKIMTKFPLDRSQPVENVARQRGKETFRIDPSGQAPSLCRRLRSRHVDLWRHDGSAGSLGFMAPRFRCLKQSFTVMHGFRKRKKKCL